MDKKKYWIIRLFFVLFTMSVSVAILPCGIINVHSLFGEITTYICLTTVSTKRLFQKNCGIRCIKRQVTGAKNKLANQMDNLSVSDEYYDKKYEDMQMRLDKLYDEIEEIETFIEAVETRLYNIKQEKISGDNVYQFLLFFDNLYDRFTDMEKKIFMKSFLEKGNIYEAEQEDGRILRSLKFRFPVFFDEQELYELDWDNESTVESVLLMRRAKR